MRAHAAVRKQAFKEPSNTSNWISDNRNLQKVKDKLFKHFRCVKLLLYLYNLQAHSTAVSPKTYSEEMQDEESFVTSNVLSEAPMEESFEVTANLPGQVGHM